MQDVIFSPVPEILVLAFFMDILLGEPPGIVHPVVWMGKGIKHLENLAMDNKRIFGICMVIALSGISMVAGALIVITAAFLPETLALLVTAYFLKSTFSFRMLLTSSLQIMTQLDNGDLEAAKTDLKALVSRDTTELDEPHLSSAVIESTSENFVDGLISPLFFYLILGLPGALAYKAVNTLDSMVGYKTRDFIELGWASARFDDVLNWIPARISLIFIFAASIFIGNPVNAVKICLRDRNLTSSPNSGWPMAAAAGSLGVKLEKQGHYVLGKNFKPPNIEDIKKSSRLVGLATIFLFISSVAIIYVLL